MSAKHKPTVSKQILITACYAAAASMAASLLLLIPVYLSLTLATSSVLSSNESIGDAIANGLVLGLLALLISLAAMIRAAMYVLKKRGQKNETAVATFGILSGLLYTSIISGILYVAESTFVISLAFSVLGLIGGILVGIILADVLRQNKKPVGNYLAIAFVAQFVGLQILSQMILAPLAADREYQDWIKGGDERMQRSIQYQEEIRDRR